VQRTRSSPSALRSPLTRHPLGGQPIYVLVNGAFGIGKTSVAKELRLQLPDAVTLDPERIGFILQRLPGYSRSDFQDLPAWRRLTVASAWVLGCLRRIVVIPMAISELAYLDEIRTGLAATGRPVLHYCLVAPLAEVRRRLASRGEAYDDPRWAWVYRRAAECCDVHAGVEFRKHVRAADRSPRDIASEIARDVVAAA